MLGALSKNDTNVKSSYLAEWHALIQKQKKEAEIRKEYEERIDAAQKRLLDYKMAQKGNAKGVLDRQAAMGLASLSTDVFQTLC